MSDRHEIKVVIRTSDGKYLAGEIDERSYTEDLALARVFNYITDRVGERLGLLERETGAELTAVAIDPYERYELCDRCNRRVMSSKVFFDGKHFLCPECRASQS